MTSRPLPARADLPDSGPFADLLLRHRLAARLGQRELANRSGLSERAVRDLERGATTQPRRASVQAVAAALGLHGDDLTRFLTTALGTSGAVPVSMSTMDDLVGRSRELRQLADLVTGGRHRFVTVTGAGGVGKSRLAAELVAALRHHTTMEIRTLDLAGLTEPDLVGEAIAQALDATAATDRILLVLDRFEHVLPAAPAVADLVRRRPGLSVLITSQRPLRAGWERQFRLAPLPIGAAVELFARRAAAVSPGFTLNDDNVEAATAICRAVDGLPLAVELAAARIRLMTPAELAARFGQQLRLLAQGAADLPARHRSLRATIEASLEVLTPDARTLFAWLGAFAGGALLADIEAVAATLGRERDWLAAALAELVDTSLIRPSGTAEPGLRAVADPNVGGGNESRYSMPDAMAELAREHLAALADRIAVEAAVAGRFLERVRRADGTAAICERSNADNVRAAFQYAVDHDITLLDPATMRALLLYYEVAGRPREGQRLFTAAAVAGAPNAYVHAGRFARIDGDLAEAARLGHLALSLLDPADVAGLTQIRHHLGAVATEAGNGPEARTHFRAALASARRAKDAGLIARALNNLGAASAETGQLLDAQRLFGAALEAKRRMGANDFDIGQSLHNLAEVALELGHHEQALAYAEQTAQALPERLAATAATVRALALLRLGRPDAAREALRYAETWLTDRQAQRRHEEIRQAALLGLRCSVVLAAVGESGAAAGHLSVGILGALDSTMRYQDEAATALEAHAALLAAAHPALAAQFLGASGTLRRRSPRPVSAATASTSDTATRRCRKSLGDKRFEQESRAGARLGAAALAEICARIEGVHRADGARDPWAGPRLA